MKLGSYRELKGELEHRKECRRDMEEAKALLEKHGIIVKIIGSRIDFCNRRIGELENAIERCREECRPHNWLNGVCTKCEMMRKGR